MQSIDFATNRDLLNLLSIGTYHRMYFNVHYRNATSYMYYIENYVWSKKDIFSSNDKDYLSVLSKLVKSILEDCNTV